MTRAAPPMLRSIIAMLLLLLVGTSAAAPSDEGITTSYGFAVFGELKYPEGFTHFDYANPDAPKGGSYRYAAPGSFDSFNTYALTGTPAFAAIYLFDSLMTRSQDEPASYYGLIAETISYPPDLSWVEFRLRPEARWHDGRPITVEDAIFTTNLFKNYKHPVFGRSAANVVRIEKTGPRSLRYHLAEKNNRQLVATVGQTAILPRHYFEGRDLSAPTLDMPVGSGPYRIGRYSAGRWLELHRVPDYWGKDIPVNKGRWNFDIVRHDYYRDATVINEAFLAGDVDLRTEMNATRWRYEATLAPFRNGTIVRDAVDYESAAFIQQLWMNMRRPFFQDRRVREAIDLAYDYEWLQRILLQGPHGRLRSYFSNTDYAAEGPPTPGELALLEPYRAQLPPEVFSGPPPFPVGGDRASQRRNLLRAAALLKEAGYPVRDGRLTDPKTDRPVVLEIVISNPVLERQIGLFRQNLARLGIEANIRIVDAAQSRFVAREADFDFMMGVPFPLLLFPQPGYDLLGTLGSEGAARPGSLNIGGISDPVVDALLMKAISSQDRQTTVDAMRAADRVLLANRYAILFYHLYPAPIGQLPISYWDRFGRPDAEPTHNFPALTMDHWWIDAAKDRRVQQARGRRG